jgi:hypothetical protein
MPPAGWYRQAATACGAALLNEADDMPSLRATGTQSMKWLSEYFIGRAMIVSLFET